METVPVRDTTRSVLPDLPVAAELRQPSIAPIGASTLSVARPLPAVVDQLEKKAEAPKKGNWWKPVLAVAAAGAAGVGAAVGLAYMAPAMATTMVGHAVTALAGAGAFFAVNKLTSPKNEGPGAPVTDQAAYDKVMGKTNTKIWWKSGALAIGALLATGALGVGLDLGLNALFSDVWAARIQTGIGSAFWGLTGALAGAVTFLFVQLVTEPVGAWISRFAAKGSPIQPSYKPDMIKSFIDINQGANAVNSLAASGAISVNYLANQLRLTVRDARAFVDAADQAWSDEENKANINKAGSLLGRTLIATETLNFAVTPEFPGVMKLLHETLGAYFEDLPKERRDEVIAAAIETVKARRPTPTDPRVPPTEAALKSYYMPMLEGLINGNIVAATDAH